MTGQLALAEAMAVACPGLVVAIDEAPLAFECRHYLERRLARVRGLNAVGAGSAVDLVASFNSDLRVRIPAYAGHAPVDRFEAIPILHKDDLRCNGSAYVAKDIDPDLCWEKMSTGTSGRPVNTIYSAAFYFEQLYLSSLKAAAVAGIDLASRSALHAIRLVDRPHDQPHLSLDPTGLAGAVLWLGVDTGSSESLHGAIRLIDRFAPAVVSAKPSVYEALVGGGRPPRSAHPQMVISGGASLTNRLRRALETFFLAPVLSAYGMTELGVFAFECSERRLHLDTTAYYIELLPTQNGAAQREIVISSLLNKAMPILRYRTGDEGELDLRPCPCGRGGPTITSLLGRIAPAFTSPNGEFYSPMQYFRGVLKAFPPVTEYQVNQLSPGRIEVLIETGRADPELEAEVLAWFIARAPAEPEMSVRRTLFADGEKFQRYRQLSSCMDDTADSLRSGRRSRTPSAASITDPIR